MKLLKALIGYHYVGTLEVGKEKEATEVLRDEFGDSISYLKFTPLKVGWNHKYVSDKYDAGDISEVRCFGQLKGFIADDERLIAAQDLFSRFVKGERLSKAEYLETYNLYRLIYGDDKPAYYSENEINHDGYVIDSTKVVSFFKINPERKVVPDVSLLTVTFNPLLSVFNRTERLHW